MERVRSENQVSRPRLRVTLANTATITAGTAAKRLSRVTMRICIEAPALWRRRASSRSMICQPASAPMMAMSTRLAASRLMMTSRVGLIGVRPVRIMKVPTPAVTASTAITRPMRVDQRILARAWRAGRGSAPAFDAAVSFSTAATLTNPFP